MNTSRKGTHGPKISEINGNASSGKRTIGWVKAIIAHDPRGTVHRTAKIIQWASELSAKAAFNSSEFSGSETCSELVYDTAADIQT